jgi:hypothetical protein
MPLAVSTIALSNAAVATLIKYRRGDGDALEVL